MKRRLFTTLRTGLALGALVTIAGLHNRRPNGNTDGRANGPGGGRRNPPDLPVGDAMRRNADTAEGPEARPRSSQSPSTGNDPSTAPSKRDQYRNHPNLDLFRPGPYANDQGRVPARSESQSFTAEEKRRTNEYGRKYGCHSCGATDSGRTSGNFTPDHQQVSSHREDPNEPQYLYPHCKSCSGKQGNLAMRLKQQGFNAYDLLNERDRGM